MPLLCRISPRGCGLVAYTILGIVFTCAFVDGCLSQTGNDSQESRESLADPAGAGNGQTGTGGGLGALPRITIPPDPGTTPLSQSDPGLRPPAPDGSDDSCIQQATANVASLPGYVNELTTRNAKGWAMVGKDGTAAGVAWCIDGRLGMDRAREGSQSMMKSVLA